MVDLASLFQNLLSGRMGGGTYDQWLKGLTPAQQQQGAQAPTVNGLAAMGGRPMIGPDGKAISPFAIAGGYQMPPVMPTAPMAKPVPRRDPGSHW